MSVLPTNTTCTQRIYMHVYIHVGTCVDVLTGFRRIVRCWFVLWRLCRAYGRQRGIVRIEGLWFFIWTIRSINIVGLCRQSHGIHGNIASRERGGGGGGERGEREGKRGREKRGAGIILVTVVHNSMHQLRGHTHNG